MIATFTDTNRGNVEGKDFLNVIIQDSIDLDEEYKMLTYEDGRASNDIFIYPKDALKRGIATHIRTDKGLLSAEEYLANL